MKQIGTAFAMYAVDFDDLCAMWSTHNSSGIQVRRGQWHQVLADYVSGNGTLWICSTAPGRASMEILKTNRDPYSSDWTSAMNGVQTIGINGMKFYKDSVKITTIKKPSVLFYAGDNVGNNSDYDPRNTNGGRYCKADGIWPTKGEYFNPCHMKTANILFVDGHTDSLTATKLYSCVVYIGSQGGYVESLLGK